MNKPVLILDPHWRTMDELFSEATRNAVLDEFEVIWGQDGAIPPEILSAALLTADVLVSAAPRVTAKTLNEAPRLRTVIEVSGAFPDSIDYAACFDAGVEILSCAPGFRQSVAEMGLAMALAGGRGLISEHEAMRHGTESWLADHPATDFTLFGAAVGFVGFGQIAQELTRLLAPFRPRIQAFDPWLPEQVASDCGIQLAGLEQVISNARCLFVTAAPTSENRHLLNAERLAMMPDNGLLVVLSRAHLVDFDALQSELEAGRIRACIDVFPSEPVPLDHPIRGLEKAILSPHRAAAVHKGRQLIGDMILTDLRAKRAGSDVRQLSRANESTIDALAGIGDASSVAAMAQKR